MAAYANLAQRIETLEREKRVMELRVRNLEELMALHWGGFHKLPQPDLLVLY